MPRRHPIALFPILALPLAAMACDRGADAAVETATVRDSAGISIVESAEPAWSPEDALAVPAEPTVAIGEEDAGPEYQLARVIAATRLGDGSIAVFDGMASEVRVFDASGRFVRRAGGRGGGPGEYQLVTWMARLPGDSLMLHDMMAQRITVLAPDGTVARTVSLAAAASIDAPAARPAGGPARITIGGLGRYRVLAPFADGSLLATIAGSPPIVEGSVTRDSVVYVRLAADGALRDTLGTFVGDETQVSTTSDGGAPTSVMVGPPPFGKTTQIAAVADGFWLGTTDRYELARLDTAGRVVRLVRRPLAPAPVTDADVAERKRLDLENMAAANPAAQASMRRMVEARWENAVVPATMPAHGPLMVGADGRLWVRETAPPADETPRWVAFDAEGRMLGTVVLPERFRALEFGADYVLGVRRDDLDVERVELYALRPAGASADA